MGFKGTKGKWAISFKDKVKCGDKVICEVISKQYGAYYNTEKQRDANALLISKAPELLEFIENTYKNLNPQQQEVAKELIKSATKLK